MNGSLKVKLDGTALLVGMAAGLGLVLYGPTIRLPLFVDDVTNFHWLLDHNWDVWTTARFFPYYRPLPFTIFKTLWHIQGRYDALALHTIMVALHSLNAVLVGLLARRLTRHPLAGLFAAALFLVFPFSYQSVALVGSLFHLTLVGGTVGAALLALHYVDGDHDHHRRTLIAAWIAGFVGIFSHENGVLLPALVGLALVGLTPIADARRLEPLWHDRRREIALLLGPLTVMAVIYFAAWLLVPKASEAKGVIWAALDVKIAYFAQGLTYPLSAFARPLFDAGDSTTGAVWLLAVIGLVTALIAVWRAVSGPERKSTLITLLVALAWIAVAAVPSVLLLDSPYVIGGPRLLYLASVGIALFWSAWLAALASYPVGRWIGGLVAVAFLVVGSVFVYWRVDDYRRMGVFYDDLIDLIEAQPDTATLVINAPAYIAPHDTGFLLGAEGTIYLPDYVSLDGLVWVNTGEDYPTDTAAFTNVLTGLPDRVYVPRGPLLGWDELDAQLNTFESVIGVQFDDKNFRPVRVGDKRSGIDDLPLTATFDGVRLYAAEASADADATGASDTLALTWFGTAPLDATVFVHALCDGQLAAQFDGQPVGGLRPLDRWSPGAIWTDYRPLSGIPCGTAATILVGLYHPATGERYPATLPDGTTTDTVLVPWR
ncbi:MAG: hypothetical protein JW966_07200 [Anaerolineae bacterium]|nr:hypothetical protein [Anaerolineae bacterium]